jgi:hypothetical protein
MLQRQLSHLNDRKLDHRLLIKDRRISRAKFQRETKRQAEQMESISSSETSVDFQRISRSFIPEDSTLQERILREIVEIYCCIPL